MDRENLITAIFGKPQIWDQRHKSHHNRYVLDKCWTEVAATCGVTVIAAKKAWKILRQQFKTHFDKLPPRKSGDPAPEDEVEWPYFKSLLFLKDIFEKRPTSGNLREFDGDEDGNNKEDDTQNYHNEINDISLPPTPSSPTSNSGHCSMESSSTTGRGTGDKTNNLGYRKRQATMDIIGKGLLEIEKEKLKIRKLKETEALDKNDEDVAFFTSLLPHVRKLPPAQKLQFRISVQQLLMESVYGLGYRATATSVTNPVPSTSLQAPEDTQDASSKY